LVAAGGVRWQDRSVSFGRLVARFVALSPPERRFVALGLLLAPVANLLLAQRGLRDAAALANRAPRLFRRGLDPARGELLVKAAFRHVPARPGCLPESVVQLALHRLSGDAVKLVVGVRREGHFGEPDLEFGGHAWIETVGGPRRDERHAVIYEVGPT